MNLATFYKNYLKVDACNNITIYEHCGILDKVKIFYESLLTISKKKKPKLDGSPNPLYAALDTIDFFSTFSRLKIF